jgi:pimeloyl-ACP methyl ester carboxylesterase
VNRPATSTAVTALIGRKPGRLPTPYRGYAVGLRAITRKQSQAGADWRWRERSVPGTTGLEDGSDSRGRGPRASRRGATASVGAWLCCASTALLSCKWPGESSRSGERAALASRAVSTETSSTAAPEAGPSDGAEPPPISVVPLAGQTPPVFVVRGARRRLPLVFLHGACCHAQGYAQSFQFASAERGLLIAPSGDTLCGAGPFSTWSRRIEELDRRIEASFAEVGVSPIGEVTVIGYSLGATRAIELVRHRPERYTRLVTIAAPTSPSPAGLKLVHSAVAMAGQRDRQDLMRAAAAAFRRAGIPAAFMLLPGASHGQMGPEAERVMAEALDWVTEHDRRASNTPP